MKQLLIMCFLIVSIGIDINCQTWFQEDDYWVNRFSIPFATGGYSEMTVLDNVVIENIHLTFLEHKHVGINQMWGDSVNFTRNYTITLGDSKVYFSWDEYSNELLFDFTLEPGDSIKYQVIDNFGTNCGDSITYYLDSLSNVELDGQILTAQHFTTYDPWWDYYGNKTIIEKIGPTTGHFIIPNAHPCWTDHEGASLCTFSNGNEEIDFLETDCYFLPVSTNDIPKNEIQIYPNPSTGLINIDASIEFKNATIIHFSGQNQLLRIADNKIDISHLNKGYYIIELTSSNNKKIYKPIVKY